MATGGRVKYRVQGLCLTGIFSNEPREGYYKKGESEMVDPKLGTRSLGH